MMDSTLGANPFAPAPSGAFCERVEPPEEEQIDAPTSAPPAPPAGILPSPRSSGFATPPSNFGEQSFQELDLSGPVASSAASGPAARFDSKALEIGNQVSAARVSSPDLAVTVSNPSKQGEGMSAFVTYTVTTRTSLPQYQCGHFSVSRRFRDFDWLHNQLVNKYPGAIVPALPERQDLKSASLKYTGVGMSAELLEQRRSQLQRFMQRVAAHPLLHSAQDLQTFLEASDSQLESWKESTKHKAPAFLSTVADVKQGAYSSASRISAYFTSDGPPSSFEAVTDLPLLQMSNYTSALQTQVQAMHKHSKNYIERHNSLASSMSTLGIAITQMANCEEEVAPSLAKGLSQMGVSVDRLASLYTEQAAREKSTFDDPLKDYVRLLSACKQERQTWLTIVYANRTPTDPNKAQNTKLVDKKDTSSFVTCATGHTLRLGLTSSLGLPQAISSRDAALKAYNSARATVATKKDKLEKIRHTGGKEEKANALARELVDAEENTRVAKQEYESVAARLDADMSRFQREKLADFKQLVVGFVSLQLEYSQNIQAQWRELQPHLEAIDTSRPIRPWSADHKGLEERHPP